MQIRIDGKFISLGDEDWKEATAQADKILRSCAYDVGERTAEEWQQALAATSSVRLRYGTPIELPLPRRKIVISDAIMTIEDKHLISQPLLFHEGEVTMPAGPAGALPAGISAQLPYFGELLRRGFHAPLASRYSRISSR
jgi:hypothetical protein